MIAAILMSALVSAPLDPVGARIAQSAAAAEALQGPVDGLWRLSEGDHTLALVAITDPASGAGLQCVWRPESAATARPIACRRSGQSLLLHSPSVTVRLRPAARDRWSGLWQGSGRRRPVSLTRDWPAPP
jgi:hypothetical protein